MQAATHASIYLPQRADLLFQQSIWFDEKSPSQHLGATLSSSCGYHFLTFDIDATTIFFNENKLTASEASAQLLTISCRMPPLFSFLNYSFSTMSHYAF